MLKTCIQPHALKDKTPHYMDISTPSIRTPECRFSNLAEWDYKPNYVEDLDGFPGLRLHYVDVGRKVGQRTALCLHGQKTWSYAFRKTIPHLLGNSYRVIAPDFFGFGQSDKLIVDSAYSFDLYKDAILALIDYLRLENITVIGFDWGAWLGATLPLDIPNKIKGLLFGNMMLPQNGFETWPGFHLWRSVQNAQSDPVIGKSLNDDNDLSEKTIAAYDAPFPNANYKASVRRFPNLIPVHQVDPLSVRTAKAASFLKTDWTGKCVCVAGLKDSLLGQRTMSNIQANIKNATKLIKVEKAGSLVFEQADQFMPQAIERLK